MHSSYKPLIITLGDKNGPSKKQVPVENETLYLFIFPEKV